jgi:hypothetical protein
MLRGLLCVTVLVGLSPRVEAQDVVGLGTGRDRDYVTGTAIDNRSTTVAAVIDMHGVRVEDPSGFEVGDAVLVWQTQIHAAAPVDPASVETTPLGHAHLTRIGAMRASEIMLATPFDGWSPEPGARLIHIPEFDGNVGIEGTLSPTPWNGADGGFVGFVTNADLELRGAIVGSGRGYRGGAPTALDAELSCEVPITGLPLPARGEGGVALTAVPVPCRALQGCGPEANGLGGGATSFVTLPAAGGGNGGRGASATTACEPGPPPQGGGAVSERLLFGGGGGASGVTGGGNGGGGGGGVVFLRARRILGPGTIDVRGESSPVDGGGGGAGGTIVLHATETACEPTLLAQGGTATEGAGPGGGGRIVIASESADCVNLSAVAAGNAAVDLHGEILVSPPLQCSACGESGYLCDEDLATCTGCAGSHADCLDQTGLPVCHPVRDVCVMGCILGEVECADGVCVHTVGVPVGRCGAPCRTDSECGGLLCDEAAGGCVDGCAPTRRDCPTGSTCTSTDASVVGVCENAGGTPECTVDLDCVDPVRPACVAGFCRAEDGGGALLTQRFGGSGCAAGSSPASQHSPSWIMAIGVLLVLLRIRRRG